MDEARDWPRLPESMGYPGINGRLSPLLHRRSPPSYRSSPSAGVDWDWPNPFPADDGEQYRPGEKRYKCRICFGLADSLWGTLWIATND